MKILLSIAISIGLVGLINYLPSWTDNRQNNQTPRAGVSKFFTDVHSAMIRAVPMSDDLGFVQNAVWVAAFSAVTWFLLRRAK